MTNFITKNKKKIPMGNSNEKLVASKELINNIDDLAKNLTHLKTTRYNGTTAFWQEKVMELDRTAKLIKKQKLDQMISHAVPEPVDNSPEGKIIQMLNTKFGKGKFESFLPVSKNRINIESIDGKTKKVTFVLSTNTLDNDSKRIVESVGFKFIKQKDILDSRRLTFQEK